MLTVSPAASEAIRGLLANPELPDDGGIRIAPAGGEEDAMELSIREEPDSGDEVVERDGANVYLASDLVAALDDKVLDARIDGNEVAFAIVADAEGEGEGEPTA